MAELRPHYIDVDLKKNTQYNVPVVTQNDTATHFIIRVTDDGLSDPELLDTYQEITMTSQRPDGESFYLTGTRIPGTNEIEFHLGTDETAFSGSVLASLQFYLMEDASRYTSAQFRYDVKKDLTKNYTPTQREETLVEVVLRDGPVAIQEAKDAKIAVDGALVELEQDKTAAIERLDEVTEENKTVFRQPVATFAALSTTYPNPEHGTTVRVTSEAASYRYSDGTWVKTDEYNPTAIDQVTAQLADTANEVDTLHLTKASYSDIEAIGNEIENIIVSTGDGSKDTELVNARTGAYGVTSRTLKERLDEVQYRDLLLAKSIAGTKQTVSFNADGSIQKVQFKNSENALIRNDVYTHDGNKIIESRALHGGESTSFIYDLTTLETIEVDSTTPTDLIVYTPSTWSEWLKNKAFVEDDAIVIDGAYTTFSYLSQNFRADTKYGLLFDIEENTLTVPFRLANHFTGTTENMFDGTDAGSFKYVTSTTIKPERITFANGNTETGRIKIKNIRLFELSPNNQVYYDFETMSADELNAKYPKELN